MKKKSQAEKTVNDEISDELASIYYPFLVKKCKRAYRFAEECVKTYEEIAETEADIDPLLGEYFKGEVKAYKVMLEFLDSLGFDSPTY